VYFQHGIIGNFLPYRRRGLATDSKLIYNSSVFVCAVTQLTANIRYKQYVVDTIVHRLTAIDSCFVASRYAKNVIYVRLVVVRHQNVPRARKIPDACSTVVDKHSLLRYHNIS